MPTMAAGDDRLSGLSDDLLRRILHFVPAQEGAFTSVLSRRWRPLWRSCGAVNLVARALKDDHYDRYNKEARGRFFARRDAVVSAAHKALDAAAAAEADGDGPVRKLTFRVEAHTEDKVGDFLHRDAELRDKHDVFAGVLSHRAARRLEELRIAAVDSDDGKPMHFETSKYEACSNIHGLGIFPLAVGSLPSKTLRVLEITNCSKLELASPPVFFPRLESLRLRHSNMPLNNLQDIIDAAPLLAIIHLDSVLLEDDEKRHGNRRRDSRDNAPPPEQDRLIRSLRCRTAISLVMDRCSFKEEGTLQIYAPMLRRFRYRGVVRHISLSPPPPHLARAEVTLTEYGYVRDRDPRAARQSLWGTVRGFSHAKEMKLRVRHLEEIATTNEKRQAKLLPVLSSLERLQLQGVYTAPGNMAAAAIENLLRSCPALRDLRINLSTSQEDAKRKFQYGQDFLERKHRSEFEESVHRFKRRRTQPMVGAGDDNDGHVNFDEVSDLPGLSGHSFECLRKCLRRVGLQFQRQTTDCFGTKLVKFFAQDAKVLEELCIDAGNERIHDHMKLKVERWIAHSSSKRIRNNNSTATTKLQVLSLPRSYIWEELV
ncbi:hypothetical protein ACQ4PT_020471 [Festuca glaucescens]